jgi:hypothetical protein
LDTLVYAVAASVDPPTVARYAGAMSDANGSKTTDMTPQRLARDVLAVFLLTFLATRILVLLIMSRRVPDLYVHVGGTHIHHLNYGIFLLSGVGAYLVFARPTGRRLQAAAIAYGVGLALTFDEFGMWVRLGGPYWQRASFDAVVVIAALLGLIAVGPRLRQFRPHHWFMTILVGLAVCIFCAMLAHSLRHAGQTLRMKIEAIEATSPQ